MQLSAKPKPNPSSALCGFLRRSFVERRKIIARLIQAAQKDLDVATVHHLRTACRRARAAIAFFEPLLPPSCAKRAHRAAKATMKLLSTLREADVASMRLTELGARTLDGELEKARRKVLRRTQRKREGTAKQRRVQVVQSARRLVDRLDKLAKRAKAGRVGVVDDAASRTLVNARLAERADEVARKLRGLATASLEELHELRIALKHWRYAAELASKVVGQKTVSRLTDRLRGLSETGGLPQDMSDLTIRIETRLRDLTNKSSRRAAHERERLELLEQLVVAAREDAAAAFKQAVMRSGLVSPIKSRLDRKIASGHQHAQRQKS